MQLVTRAQWGARPRGNGAISPFDPRGVCVHWEGAGWTFPWDHSSCDDKVRGIQAYHMDGRGWSDIAYNFLACPHGYVFEGRGLNRRSAANGGTEQNTYWYAVQCMWGTKSGAAPDALLNAARDAIDYCRNSGGAGDELRGHRDMQSTSCPGDELYSWARSGALRPNQPVRDVTIAAQAVRWAVNGTRPGLDPGEPLLTDSYAHDAHQFMAFASPAGVSAIPWTTFNSWLAYRDEPSSPFGAFGHQLALYAVKCVQAKAGINQTGYLGAETAAYIEQFGYTVVL